ncbi:hypothetical protein J6J34_07635 [Pseudidiomarina sp. 1ASP75-14]|uniref:hypothetical protein n=1 Tax=Pseudidiomarina terrestris TaxID=2820060 RepID=UPI00264B4FDA|nr:hypothetical protein [Pseudidiomarina sp. 1ASP75-14]MDN7138078.1 hypothetical protein [Pseudidiomarina sp. 1ASP75-14]
MEADVLNSISALSVIFGVAVFHLGASSKKILAALELDIPAKTLRLERMQSRKEVLVALLIGAFPNFMMLSAIFIVMLPSMIRYIRIYEFNLFAFSFMVTLFQILGFIVMFYVVISFANILKLSKKWLELL